MSELYSNKESCHKLAKILYNRLKRKIEFYGSTFQEVISGKYNYLPLKEYDSYKDYIKNELLFSYKFCESEFLRITISDSIYKKSLVDKIVALNDFCEVLSEIYGMPTLFYTIKDDDKQTLNLQWSFRKKEEDIQDFKNNRAFEDAKIDKLIIFDEHQEQNKIYDNQEIIKEIKHILTKKLIK